ncbi:MAG: hypothetical protein ACTSRK_01635 [Promethearchaeota archaeon]
MNLIHLTGKVGAGNSKFVWVIYNCLAENFMEKNEIVKNPQKLDQKMIFDIAS